LIVLACQNPDCGSVRYTGAAEDYAPDGGDPLGAVKRLACPDCGHVRLRVSLAETRPGCPDFKPIKPEAERCFITSRRFGVLILAALAVLALAVIVSQLFKLL